MNGRTVCIIRIVISIGAAGIHIVGASSLQAGGKVKMIPVPELRFGKLMETMKDTNAVYIYKFYANAICHSHRAAPCVRYGCSRAAWIAHVCSFADPSRELAATRSSLVGPV